jgi:hypothetical protein
VVVQTHKSKIVCGDSQILSLTSILFVLVRIEVPHKESGVLEYGKKVLAVLTELTVDETGGGALE